MIIERVSAVHRHEPHNRGSAESVPRISIVMPSYNQVRYLPEAIESVYSQHYPNLELIIIDGGSTDGSVEVIKHYESYITYWVSEPDHGQTHAINKGLERATGDVWAYLNSDDLLEPGSLHFVGQQFASQSELDWISGGARVFGAHMESWILKPGKCERPLYYLMPWERPERYVFPASVSCFMSRRVLKKCGPFDERLHYSMDGDYYARAILVGGFKQTIVDDLLGAWRWHAESKTWTVGCAYGFCEDALATAQAYAHCLPASDQPEIARYIRKLRSAVTSRKALWLLNQGARGQALGELMLGVMNNISNLWSRPWLGAMRQCLSR